MTIKRIQIMASAVILNGIAALGFLAPSSPAMAATCGTARYCVPTIICRNAMTYCAQKAPAGCRAYDFHCPGMEVGCAGTYGVLTCAYTAI